MRFSRGANEKKKVLSRTYLSMARVHQLNSLPGQEHSTLFTFSLDHVTRDSESHAAGE
jgi:hypothetical protein